MTATLLTIVGAALMFLLVLDVLALAVFREFVRAAPDAGRTRWPDSRLLAGAGAMLGVALVLCLIARVWTGLV